MVALMVVDLGTLLVDLSVVLSALMWGRRLVVRKVDQKANDLVPKMVDTTDDHWVTLMVYSLAEQMEQYSDRQMAPYSGAHWVKLRVDQKDDLMDSE